MTLEKIHKKFVASRWVLISIVCVFIALRMYPISNPIDNPLPWICLVIQIWIAFFLLQLNHTFNIISGRTFLPAIFYMLIVGSDPVFYNDLEGSIVALFFVISYYFLFRSYQKPKSQIKALNISLLLTVGSLLWAPLLFLFPVFWFGFYRFRCFNLRVFFASLTGIAIVYLFLYAWSVYNNDNDIFMAFLPNVNTLFAIHKPVLTVWEWINTGFIIAICSFIGVYLFFVTISERVWTISVLRYFFFSVMYMFLFFFLQSEYKSSWGLLVSVPIAFITGHFFSRTKKRSAFFLLFFCFLFFIGMAIVQRLH